MSTDDVSSERPVVMLARVPRLARALSAAGRRIALAGVPRSAAAERWDLERDFLVYCRGLDAPAVLELGTKQSVPGQSTMHRDWIPHAREFLGTDVEPGADVDVVADAHRLVDTVGMERFDVIVSCSTFEHLKYPSLAAHQLLRTLKVGGALFVQTHQSFPLHGYPSDYYRFSREGLASLFGTTMGFDVCATNYDFPAQVVARRSDDTHLFPAFLNTTLWGVKRAPTPDQYRYELDDEGR